MQELLSPKQVATSIGVSESSLKRWCDQGVIATERTPGGHRRIQVGAVIRFLREQRRSLVRPEVLGLPVGAGQVIRSQDKANEALFDALKAGNHEQARRLFIDLYVAGMSVVQLGDQVVAPALHRLGDSWQCGQIEVYQEHRACEILSRALYELRLMLPPPSPSAPIAIGGTPPGDDYRLPTLMVELVLADEGWNAVSLGSNLPFGTMAAAAVQHRPDLFWLSSTHVADATALRAGMASFLASTPVSMKVVVGGQKSNQVFSGLDQGGRLLHGADLAELQRIASGLRPTAAVSSQPAPD
ncbi:hypothetical protein Pla108_37690 [Botrimarina colliarenosi]|uniref:B12 binding domain protein n=1 Tax=Botrimarina colliarenosi TaxID=2528001 RepID=A0A5C6A3Y6_9BACT|nr:B12-binding domain-containing protein [Botrimarina colliarenosi]TWT94057.1 hypothetical protein Pla108_37690 [Botrimarina colliarenosi]